MPYFCDLNQASKVFTMHTHKSKTLVPRVLNLLLLVPLCYFLGTTGLVAQDLPVINNSAQELQNEGWRSLLDVNFIIESTLALLLASILAAIISYHPKSHRSMDTIEKVEAPKTNILYSVIGAIIGIMVLKYGLVVGFVIFGIGGLIRFRTVPGSVQRTGRMIFVTLIGLSAGLNLPHVAILSTIFGFVLIYIIDYQITYRILVKGLRPEEMTLTAEVYREVLEKHECKVLSEKKDFTKSQVSFVFRPPHHMSRHFLDHKFEEEVPKDLKGAVDWQVG